jgi:hypothetical protein
MAVVQISKIQVRRGLKNSGIGVPQLSSGEFAWAVDSQELYIGNGSLAEGAPYVGNTKILTEQDNILELAGSYQFAADSESVIYSIPRSLQSKIDEIEVSVSDFGAIGDGSTPSNEAFQNAFIDLFRNPDTSLKKVLKIPNGEYYFTSDLKIPSTAIIRGETKDGVILNLDAYNITFTTEDGLEVADFISSNRPRNIYLSNLTVKRSTGQTVLTGVKDSVIEDVIFQGEYTLSDYVSLDDSTSIGTLTSRDAAVFWQNTLEGIKTTGIEFRRCTFYSNSLSLKCAQTESFETEIVVDNCHFYVNDIGVYVEGIIGQNTRWNFADVKFEEVANQVFYALAGNGYTFEHCEFLNCGNGTSSSASPSTEMIYFGESRNNRLINCTSDRHQSAFITNNEAVIGKPEVVGGSSVSFSNKIYADIINTELSVVSIFSSEHRFIRIPYVLTLGDYVRSGTLELVIDETVPAPLTSKFVSITDNYQYSTQLSSGGGSYMVDFEFEATARDNDSDGSLETIVLSYRNGGGPSGILSFQIDYGV